MTDTPLPIQPWPVGQVSEIMYAMETDNCPRSGFSYVTLSGQPDVEAMARAVTRMQVAYPSIVCRMEMRRVGLKHLMYRVPVEHPPALTVVDDFAQDLGGRSILEALTELLEPTYTRRIDLFAESPSRFYLVRFPDRISALVIYTHHIATDGGTLMALLRSLLATYHEIVTGRAPDWADAPVMPSSIAAPGKSGAVKYSYLGVLSDMRKEARALKKDPLLIFGQRGNITSARRHIVSFTLSQEKTRTAIQNAKARKVTLNDFLSMAVIQSVDEILGLPEGTFSLWIPVNARGFAGNDSQRANVSTSINVNLPRKDRIDETRLLSAFVARRKYLLSTGRDVVSLKLLDRVMWVMRHLSLESRTPYLRKLISQPVTLFSSNVGIVWPLVRDGKLTPYSYLTESGGLEVLSYDLNFSTGEAIGHGLVAHTFNGRFSVYFSVYKEVMEIAVARRFVEGIRGRLLG